MPFLTFQTLMGILETAQTRYKKNNAAEERSLDIITFVNPSKKGSKRYRAVLTSVTPYTPHNTVKFSRNVDIVVSLNDSKKLNTLWTARWFSNSTRTFLFKMYNNVLGYNNTAHFVREHSPKCIFCDIAGNQDITDETSLHLFFQCECVEDFLDNIF
jgi:hypothetical protein